MAYPFVCTQVVAEGGTSKEIGRRSPRHGPARLRSTLPASSSLVRSPLPAVTTSRLPPAATAREIATSAATSAPPISSSNSGDIDGRCGRSFAEAQPKLRHVPDFSLIGVRRELVKPGDLMLWATQPIGFLGGERENALAIDPFFHSMRRRSDGRCRDMACRAASGPTALEAVAERMTWSERFPKPSPPPLGSLARHVTPVATYSLRYPATNASNSSRVVHFFSSPRIGVSSHRGSGSVPPGAGPFR